MTSSTPPSSSISSISSSSGSGAKWCPIQQIYLDGTIDQSSEAETHIQTVLRENLPLYIFGYGSLCWSPGDGILSHPSVTKMFGRAVGYKRCWAQKSADHRGDVHFNGLVCTLLSDEEVQHIVWEHKGSVKDGDKQACSSMTEGLVYTIPKELVKECLEELDFREKGGYRRDLINVIVNTDSNNYDDEGTEKTQTIKAMLYRGTPDNPAFSNRALLDELYAASIMSIAKGPSGDNWQYLYQLDEFLSANAPDENNNNYKESSTEKENEYIGDDLTKRLTSISKKLRESHYVYFLYGSGSNQHNQLLLDSSIKDFGNAAKLVRGDEAHELKEIVLLVPKKEEHYQEEAGGISLDRSIHRPKKLFAGGGHSALLTHHGDFYLWGWNEAYQLGREKDDDGEHGPVPSHPIVPPLKVKVESAALGHSHSLIIEKETGHLWAFGEDTRGQVSSTTSKSSLSPTTGLTKMEDIGEVLDICAGVFHSAAITKKGELITFGCGRFGQTLESLSSNTDVLEDNKLNIGRWSPPDGSRLVKVSCGRRHTLVLDEFGRVWSMGENKYKQLGRDLDEASKEQKRDQKMELVSGFLGQKHSACIDIDCGWSHSIATVQNQNNDELELYGWGRNDKSQLGIPNQDVVCTPQKIKGHLTDHGVKEACCGAESISVLDGNNDIISCGWNEHGNLGTGCASDSVADLTPITGARISSPYHRGEKKDGCVLIASGGGHFLATIVPEEEEEEG